MSEENEQNTTEEIIIEDKKISDLRPYINKFRVNFKVIEKEEEREVKNRNNPDETHRIANITVADDSASIVLTAWDEDIDVLNEEKFYSLENGCHFLPPFKSFLSTGKSTDSAQNPVDELGRIITAEIFSQFNRFIQVARDHHPTAVLQRCGYNLRA